MRIRTSLLVLSLLAPAASAAPKKRKNPKAAAKAHMEKAAKASQEGRHEDALKELDAAYGLQPQPTLLLARGHVYVKLDRCEDAIKDFEGYLASKPPNDLAAMAQTEIDDCKAKLAPPPPPPPPPTQVTSEQLNIDDENPTLVTAKRGEPVRAPQPEGSAPRQVDAPTSRAWFKDPILIGLGVTSVAAIAGGVVLYTQARGKLDDAENAATYDAWSSNVDDASRLRTYSIICGAAGGLLVGATVFYFRRAHGNKDETRVTVAPTDRGGVVGLTGRF